MPVKLKLMHVKKFGKISRENSNFSSNTIKFVPVKINFLPAKKKEKNDENEKNAREKKVGVKKLENRPKNRREIVFLPVKKSKKWLSWAFFFYGKKKTLTDIVGLNNYNSYLGWVLRNGGEGGTGKNIGRPIITITCLHEKEFGKIIFAK